MTVESSLCSCQQGEILFILTVFKYYIPRIKRILSPKVRKVFTILLFIYLFMLNFQSRWIIRCMNLKKRKKICLGLQQIKKMVATWWFVQEWNKKNYFYFAAFCPFDVYLLVVRTEPFSSKQIIPLLCDFFSIALYIKWNCLCNLHNS